MKGFFRSNIFKVLLIVVVVLAGVVILSVATGNRVLTDMLSFVTSPMQDVSTQVTEEMRSEMGLSSVSRGELESMYARLSEENKELREQLIDYYEIKQKNAQYAEALGIKEQYIDLELSAASVIGRDPGDVFGGFSIDKGYVNGIKENDPVITDKGVVGIVTKVYAYSSRVTTILSEDIKVGALSKEFMESGVVSSDIQTANKGNVRMNYLTKDTKVVPGTVITTSGSGGTFPQDLIIGEVSYLGASETDVSFYAVIKPYEDFSTVSNVFVVTNFPGKDQEAEPIDTSSGSTADDGEAGK